MPTRESLRGKRKWEGTGRGEKGNGAVTACRPPRVNGLRAARGDLQGFVHLAEGLFGLLEETENDGLAEFPVVLVVVHL